MLKRMIFDIEGIEDNTQSNGYFGNYYWYSARIENYLDALNQLNMTKHRYK